MFEKFKDNFAVIKGKKPNLLEEKTTNSAIYLSAEYCRTGNNIQYIDLTTTETKYICNKEDLLIIWDGSNSGEVFIGKDGVLSSTMAKLKISNKFLSKYVFYYLKSKFEILNNNVTGAAIPHLSRNTLENLKIYKASIAEQKEIVKVLDMASDMVRLRKECIASAQSLVPAIFQEMFGNPLINPKQLPKIKLGKIFTLSSGKFLPAKEMADNGNYPVYGGNGINGYHNEYLFEEPKLCIGRVGVKCGCVHETTKFSWITDNALYINNYLKPINQTYLKEALNQINLNQYAKRAAQPVISQSTIYQQYILEPDDPLQKQFAQKAQEIEEYIKQQQEELKQSENLFQSLLHHAFTGELTSHKGFNNVSRI